MVFEVMVVVEAVVVVGSNMVDLLDCGSCSGGSSSVSVSSNNSGG